MAVSTTRPLQKKPKTKAPKKIREQKWFPKPVKNLEDSGLSHGFISDMALKVMYIRGQVSGYQVAEQLKLPFTSVVQPIMEYLKREQMCEIRGAGGLGAGAY